jgi:hypothetical protein
MINSTSSLSILPIDGGYRVTKAFSGGVVFAAIVPRNAWDMFSTATILATRPLVGSAFVRAPEGNGCAQRFVRILKENLLWVRTFRTVEELRQALLEFKCTDNENWIIQRHS